MDQIVQFAQETIGADHAGITIIKPRKKGFDTIAPTDQVVRDVDELQHELREGPCVQAASESHTLWSDDIRVDPRWPSWGPVAAERGLHSVLSVELHSRGQRIGAMNLYGERHQQFSRDDALTARLFAYHAASALAADRREKDLELALDNRGLIGQAQGILMERFGINADQAFNVLRRYSQDRNVKVSIVARDLVRDRDL
ncbi:GAF and ANTAR domain-containing protein [Aeromicrobium fastidiosum]|nr:GAF and ANTAR domain-containing protein [Aeromicrobium fastidiosum]